MFRRGKKCQSILNDWSFYNKLAFRNVSKENKKKSMTWGYRDNKENLKQW